MNEQPSLLPWIILLVLLIGLCQLVKSEGQKFGDLHGECPHDASPAFLSGCTSVTDNVIEPEPEVSSLELGNFIDGANYGRTHGDCPSTNIQIGWLDGCQSVL